MIHYSQDQAVPIKKTKTVIDSGAGFLIEEDDDLESEMVRKYFLLYCWFNKISLVIV